MAVGDTLKGRRAQMTHQDDVLGFEAGDYGRSPDGQWWIRPPRGSIGNILRYLRESE